MANTNYYRPVPTRGLWAIVILLLAMAVLILVCDLLLPFAAARAVERVIRNPAFVIPLWAFFSWGLYHRWHRERLDAQCR